MPMVVLSLHMCNCFQPEQGCVVTEAHLHDWTRQVGQA